MHHVCTAVVLVVCEYSTLIEAHGSSSSLASYNFAPTLELRSAFILLITFLWFLMYILWQVDTVMFLEP